MGAAAAALFFASSAGAVETNGWYAAWDFGIHWDAQSTPAKSTGFKPDNTHAVWELRTRTDWTAFIRGGYRFNPHFRSELELGWRNGRISSFKTNPLPDALGPHEPIGYASLGVGFSVGAAV